MVDRSVQTPTDLHPLAAFIPFAPLTLKVFHSLIPLKWVALFTVLQIIALVSFFLNLIAFDFVWVSFSIWAYITTAMPIYRNFLNNSVSHGKLITLGHNEKLVFSNLFKICAKAVFSDYRVSLLSTIPLSLQVLVGGSFIYDIFGGDWVMHTIAGFGIGSIASKAYVRGVEYCGYSRLASYFRVDKFNSLRTERKYASAEFTLFSLVVIATVWEVLERTVYFISPVNVFRVGMEPLWNIFGDAFVVIIGGMAAWYILAYKRK